MTAILIFLQLQRRYKDWNATTIPVLRGNVELLSEVTVEHVHIDTYAQPQTI